MKNKFSTFYAIFATIFYIFCVSYFAFNIYNEHNNGISRSQEDFDSLIMDIKKNSNAYKNLSDEALKSYNSLNIYKNNKLVYNFSRNNSSESSLIKNYIRSFSTDSDKYFIEANLYILKPYSIFYYARNAFILVFIFSFITVILIVLSPNSKTKDVMNYEEENEIDESEIVEDVETEVIIDSNENESVVTEIEKTETEENIQENLEKETPSETVEEIQNSTETDRISVPEGLYSPDTGFGWESYLFDRLESEINRAIASESDISLYVIKLQNLSRKDPKTKDICNYLISQFQFKDLIFEFKEDSFVIIHNNTALETALNLAGKLLTDINSILENTDCKCFIGITAKSIRIVSGDRLLKEAVEALNHAQEDEKDPIIAFQVNSDKYFEFIEKQ